MLRAKTGLYFTAYSITKANHFRILGKEKNQKKGILCKRRVGFMYIRNAGLCFVYKIMKSNTLLLKNKLQKNKIYKPVANGKCEVIKLHFSNLSTFSRFTSKHLGGWANSRKLFKPWTTSREKVLYSFYKIILNIRANLRGYVTFIYSKHTYRPMRARLID